jgi:hypothetical protein
MVHIKKTIIAAIILTVAIPATANADEDVSVGCLDEVTGEAGLLQYDGNCVTPAEYDVLFGFENLSTIPDPTDPTRSIAEVAEIVPDVASERPLGDGLVIIPFTFRQMVDAAQLRVPV